MFSRNRKDSAVPPSGKTAESLSLYSLHSDHCVLAVDIPFLRYAVFRTTCQFISQNLAADGFFVLLCDLGQLIVAIDGYADVIGHCDAGVFTDGRVLADVGVESAFLPEVRCQRGIENNGHPVVFLRHIAFLLCHVDQQIVLGQFHSHTVYIEL